MNCKGCKYYEIYRTDEWIEYAFHFCAIDPDGYSISESWRKCKGKHRIEKVKRMEE